MTFRKYDHVERLGHTEVEDIVIGQCYIFPKLDGTNASVWAEPQLHTTDIKCGSRTREIGIVGEDGKVRDNHGFATWVAENHPLFLPIFEAHPTWRLYGEWLVPHTLKTYREEAWRQFYVFDVHDGERYVPFEEYRATVFSSGLHVISPLCTIQNPTPEQLQREVEMNTYLINDSAGVGEGIVIKNYEWTSKFGRQPWAKIVRNEFKEENRRAFGTPEKDGGFQVEAAIAEEYVTQTLVSKTRAKIIHAIEEEKECHLFEVETTHKGALIPRLLQTVYYEIIQEEMWEALKKYKDPTIDFKKLRKFVTHQTKIHIADLL